MGQIIPCYTVLLIDILDNVQKRTNKRCTLIERYFEFSFTPFCWSTMLQIRKRYKTFKIIDV